MKAEDIKTILENAKAKGAYQTELGTKGKNLSASVKESIEALQLPGIEFTQTVERKYPNSYFASTLIGYAQYDEEQKAITGRMGLEETLNKYLTGKDGKTTSQKDKNGNIIKEWQSITEAAHSLGASHQGIQACCSGKQKTCKGFVWNYKKD